MRQVLIWLVMGCALGVVGWSWLTRRQTITNGASSLLVESPGPSLHAKFSSTGFEHHSTNRFAYRLTNTSRSLNQLVSDPRAILLQNASIDTASGLELAIPASLRSQGEPGSYVVQCRGVPNDSFQRLLTRLGATAISYIPNNAFLVRVDATVAKALGNQQQVSAVIPYEPYYKLAPPLLEEVLSSQNPAGTEKETINVLFFDGASQAGFDRVTATGIEVLGRESSPFGMVAHVRASQAMLVQIAGLAEVEEVEPAHARVPANDLSRVRLGVSSDPVSLQNYLGLTGSNVLVNVNDLGVDSNQPELAGRVFSDIPSSATDTNGHGTHVAGIIASSGSQSLSVTNASGSLMPPSPLQFRGMASRARVLSIRVDTGSNAPVSDAYLQQTAAGHGAFISNNSWHYADDTAYDLGAASYDAAVRDALPSVAGEQPLLCVFAAGNLGAGADDGTGGIADSIQSPGTAKNVITVGAIEQPRFVTNQAWSCSTNGSTVNCQTNAPWLLLTDSSNQIAAFSSRGNTGLGIEGEAGRFKPDVVAPGTFIVSTRSGVWDQAPNSPSPEDPPALMFDANQWQVMSNLNSGLGPFYRFESGTSLSAAEVSGTLALMQEFFEQRMQLTNSPALMKALLINGARPLGIGYALGSSGATNSQGWGVVQLPNSLPGSLTNVPNQGASTWFVDQSADGALATAQQQTRFVSVAPAVQNSPLRITLVWSDPPANPVAGLKLVNDLDLVVTNLQTGEVFWGNDIPSGAVSNSAWQPGTGPKTDQVNNVENVFLAPNLGSNYSVTVVARRVAVNAVIGLPGSIAQDYALVISAGDSQLTNALSVADNPIFTANSSFLTVVTNDFGTGSPDFGAILPTQRVAGIDPSTGTNVVPFPMATNSVITIGTPNQWQFYVFTNETDFTNAVFLTFAAKPLSLFPSSTNTPASSSLPLLWAPPADVDLYVSRDPGLTNLDPTAIASADISSMRGGIETIIYSNATPGAYYIGVKSESPAGVEFNFAAFFSQQPFAQSDPQGNELLRGFPEPGVSFRGNGAEPVPLYLLHVTPDSFPVRRVIVTNVLSSSSTPDLELQLIHNSSSVVLQNHTGIGPASAATFVYDDSDEGDIPGARKSDGPGSLRDFGGQDASGQWLLTLITTNQPATNLASSIFLEQQPDLSGGLAATVLPGACREDYVVVPFSATNLTASVTLVSGTGPASLKTYPSGTGSNNTPELVVAEASLPGQLTVDETSQPPLAPGLYTLRSCNPGPDPLGVTLQATTVLSPFPLVTNAYSSTGKVQIVDAGVSDSTLWVTNADRIISADVGVRLDHPRVSDLVLSLISPAGTRVLLDAERGGQSSAGMGTNQVVTNMTQVSFEGGPIAVTNVFDTGETSGNILIQYDFFMAPDDMRVYYETNLLYDSGLVSSNNNVSLQYGPGTATSFSIVMNQGGNTETGTAWHYSVTTTAVQPLYLTFTENTNLTLTPIKFAPTPFNSPTFSPVDGSLETGIFYVPEQSLNSLVGQSASGLWTLEIWDSRTGATSPPPTLVSWQLALVSESLTPTPIVLAAGSTSTNLLGPSQLQWYAVDVPDWVSFATNSLLWSTAPVNVFFNSASPPTGTNPGDVAFALGTTNGDWVLRTNASPGLLPGSRYYLGIQNTNSTTISVALELNFNIANLITLPPGGGSYSNTNAGPLGFADTYLYVVTTNAQRVQFEVNAPTSDVTLVARKGPPPPSLLSYDYISANPGTNDELIVVYNFSQPVALSPGEWFLSVVNVTGVPAEYTIMATEFTDAGTNLTVSEPVFSNNTWCLTWTSLPGIHYYVQGKLNLADPEWITVSPTVTAMDYTTTYCVPVSPAFQYFRVSEGLVLSPALPIISSIVNSSNGVLLQWNAPTNAQFMVQWTPSLTPASWQSVAGTLSSTNGTFLFFDDGTLTGGLDGQRFYRLEQTH